MHEGRPGTFVEAIWCIKPTVQQVAMYEEQIERSKYDKGINYNIYKSQAKSIDKSENWCEIGAMVNGLLVHIENKSYIMIEAWESGEGWLEHIEVDPKTIKDIE